MQERHYALINWYLIDEQNGGGVLETCGFYNGIVNALGAVTCNPLTAQHQGGVYLMTPVPISIL